MTDSKFIYRPFVHNDFPQPGFDRKDKSGWVKLFFREPPGQRHVHVHVRVSKAPNALLAIWFRDWLREDDIARQRYAQMKSNLATACAQDLEQYVVRKDERMQPFLKQAIRWGQSNP